MSIECPMCKRNVSILKTGSHILPRFFLRIIRDPKSGQIRVIDVFKAIIDSKSQDLPKGDFICETCETLTANLDSYAAKILKYPNKTKRQRVKSGKIDFELCNGLDFQKFRDFVISVVVRDHCWRKSENLQTFMSDSEYESLRFFLISGDATDDTSFPIIMHKILPLLNVPNIHNSTSPPVISTTKDAVTFIGMGYAFMMYFKASVSPGMDAFIQIFKLKNDGTLRTPFADFMSIGTFKNSHNAIIEAYRKYFHN